MERKIIIAHVGDRVAAVLSEEGKIVEIHYSPQNEPYALGSIYVGKVRQILPNINAAFIEIGDKNECYYSTEEKYSPIFTSKAGKKPLCVGDELLVQIQKEAVRTKKPVVTGTLNFTGRYAVLTSGNLTVGVSSKISKPKREELLAKAESYGGRGYGFILRTNAADVPWETVAAELEKLEEEYFHIRRIAGTRTCFSCLKEAPKPYISMLRDIYQSGLAEIVAESGTLYEETRDFLAKEQPDDLRLLRCYTDEQYPLSKCYSMEHVTEEALRERVWLKSGSYLVIQETEAMHVIDVNSGRCMKKKKEFLAMNLEAAKEAARQIRLRNLSGIIMIDFINMGTDIEKQELLAYFQHELNKDRNPGNVIDMTKLQIVEVTRKKVKKTLKESLYE